MKMKCPIGDTCPESEGCPHKDEHDRNVYCALGYELTKLTDCPRCLPADDAMGLMKARIRFAAKTRPPE